MYAQAKADFEAKKEAAIAAMSQELGEVFDEELDPNGTGFCDAENFATIYNIQKELGNLRELCGPDVDIDDVNAVFKVFDTDNDGKISKAEFLRPFSALAIKPVVAENERKVEDLREMTDEVRDSVMKNDIGKKGYLTKDEFRTYYDKEKEDLKEGNIAEVVDVEDFEVFFSFIDRNGNGQIEPEEIEYLCTWEWCVDRGVMPHPY